MDVLPPREAAKPTQPGMTWEKRGTDPRHGGVGGAMCKAPVNQFLGEGVQHRSRSLGKAFKLGVVQQGTNAVGGASKGTTKSGEAQLGQPGVGSLDAGKAGRPCCV